MDRARLYEILRPESPTRAGQVFRLAHHAMVALGIGIMLADTVESWRQSYPAPLDLAFQIACAFFLAEYVLRLIAAPAAPGAEHRGVWRSRLAWAISIGGICDGLGALPGFLDLFDMGWASMFAFVWVFKYVRYSAGLFVLRRVVRHARHALLSVLLGLAIVLLAAASLAYLLERGTNPHFSSIPAALWWAIVTITTTGYGDVVPQTIAGRVLAGIVMVGGILVFALWAGILATGYSEELRRREFLLTWDLVAKVPFFHHIGASVIAEVARMLRPRDYPAGAVIVRRGEPGDCMFFVAEGEVEIQLRPEALYLGAGQFFGEMALLTGAPRNATVVASQACTLLTLDIVEFRELMARQPDLARTIQEESDRRHEANAAAQQQMREAAMAMEEAP
jgi:voltage-gated potassium channel